LRRQIIRVDFIDLTAPLLISQERQPYTIVKSNFIDLTALLNIPLDLRYFSQKRQLPYRK
ncbi:6037_t:CDS:1, partial [Rhizophagus irregularis]